LQNETLIHLIMQVSTPEEVINQIIDALKE